MNLDDHLGTAFCECGRIANELQSVAKTLFGPQQYRFPRYGFAAPGALQRLVIGAGQTGATFPARFKVFPALRKVAQQQLAKREVPAHLWRIGRQGQSARETVARFIGTAQVLQHRAEVIQTIH